MKANRLSLNIKKNKYTFFQKNSVKGNTHLKLPKLKSATRAIDRTNAIKVLGVLLDENITWKTTFALLKRNLPKTLVFCIGQNSYLINHLLKRCIFLIFTHI